MPIYLLVATTVVFACILFNKVSSRLGIPMLLAFILLGMFFGSDGVLKIRFDNFFVAEQICSIALIFILFYGGFGTKWSEAKPTAVKAMLLSSLGVVMTAGITGLFCYFALKMPMLESLLIGSVISSTDAASVFSILRSKRLNLKHSTAPLLELESGSNDPFSYMLTVTILSIMGMGSAVSVQSVVLLLFTQVAYAVVFGVIVSALALWVLKNFNFGTAGFDAIFVFGIAVLSYAAPSAVGGNGYLCAYIVGILLGNCSIPNKKALVHFFDGVTGLMQMLIFFLLGLLSFPSKLGAVVVPAMLIALFLTFVARPISVFLLMSPFGAGWKQQVVVSWAGLRGAASIVFAIIATTHPAYMGDDVFHIVFCIVLFSILIQGSLLPWVSERFDMIDDSVDVLKSFNDYSDEVPIQFIQLTVSEKHHWAGKRISEVFFPPDTLVVLLKRGDKSIIPRGNTMLKPCDKIILSAKAMDSTAAIELTEVTIGKHHEWRAKRIAEIPLGKEKLIVLIKRGEKIVIPSGRTELMQDDILVINKIQSGIAPKQKRFAKIFS